MQKFVQVQSYEQEFTVKICRHLTTKILTFSSAENDDKPLSVDETFVICDDRFVTYAYAYNMGDDSVIKWQRRQCCNKN